MKILVATDFSKASRHALDAAAALAKDLDATIILVHALLAPSRHQTTYGSDPIGLLEQDIGRDEAMQFHEEWAEPLRKDGITVETVVVPGHPTDVILDAASSHDAAMIVIGRQGWGRLERFRLGSVSRKISERATLPVVLVPVRA